MTMTALVLPSLLLIVGLALLVWSSDTFVDGAASTATHLKISPLVIGVVVLGFGTSMPEIVVSTLASLDGNPGIAIGNAVGSNIANIGLVLGVSAIIAPIVVKSSILRREMPVLLIISAGAYMLVLDNDLDIYDGILMLLTLVVVMFWMIRRNRLEDVNDPLTQETMHELEEIPEMSQRKSLLMLLGGLVLLIISAKMMVHGAVEIAEFFQVPDVIIGLTIIAIGTSLPELAAAIAAARKNEADLIIGNIIGSNLFNTLAVLAVPAILAPSLIQEEMIFIDMPVMVGLTLGMLILAMPLRKVPTINRTRGVLLFLVFVGYLYLIYLRSTGQA
ncbi:putative antiporter CaxA [uncultured Thiomicrorhabdus sp.]